MTEDEDFRALVGKDVKPIEREVRVAIQKAHVDAQSLERRRLAAVAENLPVADPLGGEPVEVLSPFDILEFKRPGVQNGVYKNLRLAKYPIDARLDLHKLTVERARKEVYSFIQDCVANDVRTALITHGKGEGRAKPAVLKSYLFHWLPQLPEVLASHSAQKQHGGTGATYILLKKSERKKLQNKQLHERD